MKNQKSENHTMYVVFANTFTITCYGETKIYPESMRKAMMKEFMVAMAACEGSEKERYTNIFLDLASGAKECTDE